MKRAAAALAALVLGGCAYQPVSPDAFSFAAMGDTPYNEAEEKQFLAMMERIDREDVAFVVHVGDIKGGGECSDALFERRKAQFERSAHPFIYTPGDNEWIDCRANRKGPTDPIERLAKLRSVFFPDRFSLGREKIETFAQERCIDRPGEGCRCPAHPENRFWTRAGVRFVTLNISGSDNNVGYDAANDAEASCRDEANRAWLEQAVRASERSQTRALVVMIQANPWISKKPVFKPFLAQLQQAAKRLAKPVLFIHGDTHFEHIDQPFTDDLGNTILNLTRLEVFGSPFVGWVKVDVDPLAPDIFRFTPHLQAVVK